MNQYYEAPASTDLGFSLITRRQRLKRDVHKHGEKAIESILAACIVSGMDEEDELQDAVADIAGDSYEGMVSRLLMERENITWARTPSGRYVPYL